MESITQNSNLVKWSRHKEMTEKMAKKLAKMKSLPPQRATRMMQCGDIISGTYCPTCGKVHYTNSNRCRDRLCPLCSWRLSIQRYHEMIAVLDVLRPDMERMGSKVCMLTLTVRNVRVGDLRATMQGMSQAWKRLRQSKAFNSVWGWARCCEITYNAKAHTMHPHMHILLVYDSSDVNIATTMNEMKAGWKRANRLNYSPIIDLREAYSKAGEDELIAAAGEAFAYSIKPATTGLMSIPMLERFANEIGGLRLIGYGKAIKKAREQLGFKDESQEDEHDDSTVCECGTELEHMVLAWSAGGYHNLEEVSR